MRKIPAIKRVFMLAALTAFTTSCGERTKSSRLDTVDIPLTPVKSQGRVGFCWSYAAIGFVENVMKKKTGVALDLSEEALGYHRMAEELVALSRKYAASELADAQAVSEKVFEGLEGWDVTFNPAYNPGAPVRNAFQLMQMYGVVPEADWSYKFTSDQQLTDLMNFIYDGFAKLMQTHGKDNVTRAMIFDLLNQPQAFGKAPPQSFSYLYPDGSRRDFTSVNFLSDVIGFTPDDYTYLISDQQIGYDQFVSAMKLSLSRGLSVPFSYIIYQDTFDDWDASYSIRPNTPLPGVLDGGHAVLVTDFVNIGGKPGAVSSEVLTRELSKPASDLNYVVIKNSWGTRYQSPLLPLPGFHTVDQSYLRELSKVQTHLSIVVPRDIAMQVRYGN